MTPLRMIASYCADACGGGLDVVAHADTASANAANAHFFMPSSRGRKLVCMGGRVKHAEGARHSCCAAAGKMARLRSESGERDAVASRRERCAVAGAYRRETSASRDRLRRLASGVISLLG